MKITPYLHFNGNAREAIFFYKDLFDGDVEGLSTYGEAPMPSNEEYKDKLIHARLLFGGNVLMVSDIFQGQKLSTEGNIQLSVQMDDDSRLSEVFNALAAGGKVTMELQDTFWGATFGMLQDKFGVNWMVNCGKKKEEAKGPDKTLDITG